MDDFILWIQLLFSRWQYWVSGSGVGGLVIIILALGERFNVWAMPKKWYILIFIVLFMFSSSFMAWKDEHKQVVALTKKIADITNKKEIRKALTGFLSQATVIHMHCEGLNVDHSPVSPDIDTYAEFKDWNERLHKYLDENLDNSYSLILEDNSGTPVFIPHVVPQKHKATWLYVEQRKVHLRRFIEKFE